MLNCNPFHFHFDLWHFVFCMNALCIPVKRGTCNRDITVINICMPSAVICLAEKKYQNRVFFFMPWNVLMMIWWGLGVVTCSPVQKKKKCKKEKKEMKNVVYNLHYTDCWWHYYIAPHVLSDKLNIIIEMDSPPHLSVYNNLPPFLSESFHQFSLYFNMLFVNYVNFPQSLNKIE